MTLRNTKPNIFKKNNKELELQVLDWQCYDEFPDDIDFDEYDDEDDPSRYVMTIFGLDSQEQSISVKVTGFRPRFYVNIPKKWADNKIQTFLNTIRDKVRKPYNSSLQSYKIMRRKKFRGFTNNEKFKFIRLNFYSHRGLQEHVRVLQKKISHSMLSKKPKKYEIYESNIDPFLRFCHINNIQTSGWIVLPAKKYKIPTLKTTYCQNECVISWNDVKPSTKSHIAPLLTLSFDIECDSSHGDFPLASKNYKKLAAELLDNITYRYKKAVKDKEETRLLQKDKNTQLEILVLLINLAFQDKKNLEEISFCYTKYNVKPKAKDIQGCANKIKDILFIQIKREENYKELREAVDKTKKQWGNQSLEMLFSYAKENGKKSGIGYQKILHRIITRDILVEKTTDILDSYFPELEGDKIIQIGSTINKYGEDFCCIKHIVTLDTCNPIKNSMVVPCQKEEDVIREWFKFVIELDPDIVTGYNIFGFDYKFIYDRAVELDLVDELGSLGRIRNKELELVEKNLSSSALGENILTYLDMPGRVQMDLLKVVQKDHKLASYKLDSVAENFISGGIKSVDANKLEITDSDDLQVNNYITISTKKDKYQEGKKFQIVEKQDNHIFLDSDIDTDIVENKPTWRLAKDDIGPKDIFRLQKQDAEGRKIVAQYCLQDCALCNKLVTKLSILSNNIGMANVCSVPLTYIFLRGQGIKILSLVSKECRDYNFLLPLLKKPKTEEQKEREALMKKRKRYKPDSDSEEEEDTGGYEGAIVLPPNPGIYLETPITVLDYSSLYPSSMISENLSHDTYVMDPKYDNLPGVEYKDKTYDVYEWIDPKIKSKGKRKVGQKTCRFVQLPNGEKGVIPKILMKLLAARKTTRKKILYKTANTKDGESFSGLLDSDGETELTLRNVEGESMTFIKKDIATIKDTYNDFEKEVLDGLQLAYKVTANSLYGQIGAQTSAIYLKDIAASTTATGRELLYLAREKTEEKFKGAKVVYGDSIPHYEFLQLEVNGKRIQLTVLQVKDNYFVWNNDDSMQKQYYVPRTDYEIYTFTETGKTKVISLMEHNSQNNIMRIMTKTGTVHVTDEHSLLLESGKIITPRELKVGDILMSFDTRQGKPEVVHIKNLGPSQNYVYDLTTENHHFQAGTGNIVVHNTDSIFINFNPTDVDGKPLKNIDALQRSIELGVEAEKYIQQFLSKPHKLEYEKTFWPFILFTKKRYIGDKYEFSLDKYKQTSMGIVTKRRDNAEIVKHVYKGIMNIIMKDKDIGKSLVFLQQELRKLIDGYFPLEMLTISKCLKSYYKNPESICHKVLADRIGEREPGNKPLPNDRIPYIYIEVEKKKGQTILQGDKVEHPNFIRENKLKPDYLFYITNQIMKPVAQIYALIVNQLPGYSYDEDYLNRLYLGYLDKHGEKKAMEKITQKRNDIAAEIIFQDIIREVNNRRQKIKSIDTWCSTKKTKIIKKIKKTDNNAVDHRKVNEQLEKQGTMKPLTSWFTVQKKE